MALPLAGSDAQKFDFTDTQKKRLAAQERHKKRWQRRQARRTQGLAGCKAKRKVARYQHYSTDVRRDVAHKTSGTLANDPRHKLFAFEALKVKSMTKRAKPKQDEQGRWIKKRSRGQVGTQ